MTRSRGDPLWIFAAQRAGLAGRLTSYGRLSPASADRWIDAWQAEAKSRGLDARGHEFWDPAYDWIIERAGSTRRRGA
jgi:hypothetical protein